MNHLRINNWYYVKECTSKRIFRIMADDFSDNNLLAQLIPIRLKSECMGVLEKKELVVEDNVYILYKVSDICNIYLMYDPSKDEYFISFPLMGNDAFHVGKQIQYVHELQNLYFALNGEDVEVYIPFFDID